MNLMTLRHRWVLSVVLTLAVVKFASLLPSLAGGDWRERDSRTNIEAPRAGSSSDPHPNRTKCCFPSHPERLTPEYFANMTATNLTTGEVWMGGEYEIWRTIHQRLESTGNDPCAGQWTELVIESAAPETLQKLLNAGKMGKGEVRTLPYRYIPERNDGRPRVLILGDSITLGIFPKLQLFFGPKANFFGPPTNCAGASKFLSQLEVWLGGCPWDMIHFNLGHHMPAPIDVNPPHSTQFQRHYRVVLVELIGRMRRHSPQAKLVLALTTPSPFDNAATVPDRATCRSYDKFYKAGVATLLNNVAAEVAQTLDLTINDRYSAVQPALQLYQEKCDVHFSRVGNEHLARQDWNVISKVLGLETNLTG